MSEPVIPARLEPNHRYIFDELRLGG